MVTTEGSFIRWQSITITQLGYAVNLILTFSTASVGFALMLIKDNNVARSRGAKCLWMIAVVVLLASIVLGMSCVNNRLRDFRKTKRIAQDRERMERKGLGKEWIDSQLAARRKKAQQLGKQTWKLFRWQVGTFGSGIVALIGAFACTYHEKLF